MSQERCAPQQRGYYVLLVEDHQATRAALAVLLKRRGCTVTSAASVAEAREHAAEKDFDLLISDLGLPDGDGCDLMAELHKRHAGLLGIAITGFGMENDIVRSREAGFREHLTKPISISSLERAFDRVTATRGDGT